MESVKETLTAPIFKNNPIALQILGICSALAVTSSLQVTLVMCVALTFVCAFANLGVSLIRQHIPPSQMAGIESPETAGTPAWFSSRQSEES